MIRRDPHGAQDRHEQARERRGITRHSDPDGMATLKVFSTLPDIATIHAALTAMSDAARTPDDDRTADNRRVDVLVDLCTDVLDTGRGRAGTYRSGSGAARTCRSPCRSPRCYPDRRPGTSPS